MCSERMMKMISNIKKLGIRCTDFKDYNLYNLGHLQQLEKLKLVFPGKHRYDNRWKNPIFPLSLKKLTLCGLRLPWKEMRIISSLPSLQILKLRNYACDGITWKTTKREFKQLEFLLIDGSNLLKWQTISSHFPKLKSLVLHGCPHLKKIPRDIGNISTLELINVDALNKSLVESAKVIQRDQEVKRNYGFQVCYSNAFPTQQLQLEYPITQSKHSVAVGSSSRLNAPTGKIDAVCRDRDGGWKKPTGEHLEKLREAACTSKLTPAVRIGDTVIEDRLFHEEDKLQIAPVAVTARISSSKIQEDISTPFNGRSSRGSRSSNVDFGQVNCSTVVKSDYSGAVGSSSRLAPTGKIDAVGLDRDVEAIKERLFNDTKELQIIPIVGTGGIGKTTLARKVYDDSSMVGHFDICAWVTVPQDYNFKDIFLNLLVSMKDFVKEEVSGLNNQEMAVKVHQTLMGRRYLIVIDDMWSTEAWDEIRSNLPDDSQGSRIILTTRLEDVAAYAGSSNHFHMMQFLRVDQSWDLLQKEVFRGKEPSLEMEVIGRRIAKSCGGLPLAIVVVAGLLSDVSQTKDDWEQIANNINLAISADEENYAAILSLSFTRLPDHLKQCFMYMGAFPEDYEIRVSKLIKLWIAEGFLESTGTRTPEDVAEEFVEDLVKRNLVLVTKRKSNGRIKSCGLHDLLRDLCLVKSLEENFLLCFMGSLFLPEFFNNQLRISISDSKILAEIGRSKICTVICFGHSSIESLEKLVWLRILDMLNTNVPAQVFELRYLKLLAFRSSTLIPATISNLENLQTLIFYPNEKCMVSFPVEIWKMRQLRHLISSSFHPLPIPEEATLPLENLQTLSIATNFVCSGRMVEMIPSIKKLGLCYSGDKVDEDYHLENLELLNYLEKLKLERHGDSTYESWLNLVFPKSLKKLTLSGWRLPWERLSIVGSLPNLQVLKLKNYACDGTTWETIEGEFEQLEVLLVDESNLREWLTQSNHFPKLKSLVLHRCPSLSEIPEDIGEIPTLELIEVDRGNQSLVDSAKMIQNMEDYGIQVRYSNAILTHQRELIEDLGSTSSSTTYDDQTVSRTAPTNEDIVVGLKEDWGKISGWLTSSSSPLEVLAIVGMEGIGKTALAKSVYNHPYVRGHFDIRAWVTISQGYSIKAVYSDLLTSIRGIPLKMGEFGMEEVHKWLRLTGKRYQIVMDNVWNRYVWDEVRMCLPDNNNGSRIIVTTRDQDVADYASRGNSHTMPFLDANQSWHLFQQKVFANQACPLELQAVGKEIVESCGGLPLSIVRKAEQLSKIPRTMKSWEQIAAGGEKLETTPSPSLDHLPHHLKECFLYMAGFPQDYEICVSEIIKLWVAEGFLRCPTKTKSLEEEAEDCLEDLVSRSLVLVTSRKVGGKTKSCKLHNTVRDLCVREAGQQKLILPLMDYSRSPVVRRHFLPQILENYQRVSASWYDLDLKDSMHRSSTKTIICIPQRGYRPKGSVRNFTSLKVLHVLRRNDCSYWDLGEVFDHTDLTYLASNIPSSIVPPAISILQNLQTLIIYRSEVCLPSEIWRMPQLRHLMAFSFHPLPDPEDGDPPLENLQTLSLALDLVCSQRMVVMIPNIKKLGVGYSGEKVEGGYHLDKIAQFLQLEKLKLEMPTLFWVSLPVFPESLKKLNLSGGRLPWRDMKIISSLPHLQVLKLRNYACEGEVWETTDGEFQQLKILVIDESNLRYWVTEYSHFPELQSLMLYRCPYLYEIPSDIGEIPTLELIEIDDDNQPLLDSAKKIQEEQFIKVRVKHS